MTNAKDVVRHALADIKLPSPSLRQVRTMFEDEGTTYKETPSLQSADELRSIWSIRLWNVIIQGHRISGLPDFVRKLSALEPNTQLRQITLHKKSKTALIFLEARNNRLLGAVISNPTAAQRQRGADLLALANSSAPAFLEAHHR